MATSKKPVTTAKTEEKETVKEEAKVTETVKKSETLKIEAEKKEEPKKIEAVTPVALVEASEEKEVAPKKKPGRKPAAKKAASAEKAPARAAKTTKTTTKKTTAAKTAKKAEKKEDVILQFGGREINDKDLVARVNEIWIKDLGKKAADLKDLRIYVKPEEYTAYYVINDDITGSFDL